MRKTKIAIASLIALSGFSYLIISGFKESGLYYMTVGELLDSSQESKKVKVEGDVVAGSIKKDSHQLSHLRMRTPLEFEITDGGKRLSVRYNGVDIPSAFKEEASVVVEGRYKPKQRLFEATNIITKCPSKYEAKDAENMER